MRHLVFIVACSLALLAATDARAEAPPGTVEGHVTPVEWSQEIEVCVIEVRPSEDCIVPAADGSYVFPELGTSVRLAFIPSYRSRLLTQYYNHQSVSAKAETIGVPSEGIDADLVEGGAIAGTVTAESGGAPLSEVEVCAVSVNDPESKSCGESESDGAYELHSLPTGPYRVGFWGEGQSAEYALLYYQDELSPDQATPVEVTAGETTPGIDATLAKGAEITGVVTAATGGLPLGGITICLFAVGGSTARRCTESGTSGAYSFQGLPGGGYQVGFSLGSAESGGEGVSSEDDGYLTQYYAYVPNRSEGQTVTLSGEQVAGGIDARLLSSALAPPAIPTPPVTNNTVASPNVIVEHTRTQVPGPTKCKKGQVKKKVKGAETCVRKKPAKKHRKSKEHGNRAGKSHNRHQKEKGKS